MLHTEIENIFYEVHSAVINEHAEFVIKFRKQRKNYYYISTPESSR